MNREIKFRGYSEELKSFVYGFYQEVEVEGIGYSYLFWQGNTTHVRADSVAQFTGMYDKNGKEIYEDDILKREIKLSKDDVPNVFYERVVWNETSFCTESLTNKEKSTHHLGNFTFHTIEVIGNAFENPELLNNVDILRDVSETDA